jgi:hypothetical protein
MDVDHRRRDVGVAHVRLDVGEREHLNGQRAEGVAQVVKADWLEAGCLARGLEAPPERRVLEVLTDLVAEDEVLVAGEVLAAAEIVDRPGDLVDDRDAAHPPGLRHPSLRST